MIRKNFTFLVSEDKLFPIILEKFELIEQVILEQDIKDIDEFWELLKILNSQTRFFAATTNDITKEVGSENDVNYSSVLAFLFPYSQSNELQAFRGDHFYLYSVEDLFSTDIEKYQLLKSI